VSGESFDSWAVLELMGHVRMAGRVTEEERFGCKMGRIDVPLGDGFTTVYFGGGSVYRMVPVTEELARSVAEGSQPKPVHPWELPKPKGAAVPREIVTEADPDGDDGEGEDDEEDIPFYTGSRARDDSEGMEF
jgi:hypothetical protein